MNLMQQATNVSVDDPPSLRLPPDPTVFKILQINIRGLNRMEILDSLCVYLHNLNASIDVIVIGETWIKQGRAQFYNIPGYQSTFSCRNTSAGGLAIFVRNDLSFETRTNIVNGGFHHIAIKVDKRPTTVFVHGLYRPPSDDVSHLFSTVEEILSNSESATPCFIVGDVNLPVNQPLNLNVQRYHQLLHAFSATVSNTIITRPSSNNLLDHVV